MFEHRKTIRYPSFAHARIPGLSGTDALLKDLSVTGCCVEYTMFVDVKSGDAYNIEIIPEKASNIEQFVLPVEVRWVRPDGYSCDIGFTVLASPKGKSFQRYVDYLTWRSST
jgi:hypothetical protein